MSNDLLIARDFKRPFPQSMSRDRKLSMCAKIIYIELAQGGNQERFRRTHAKMFANKYNIAEEDVLLYIDELVNRGHITMQVDNYRKENLIEFHSKGAINIQDKEHEDILDAEYELEFGKGD